MNSASAPTSFLARHDFLLRRLHSLTGLVPVGAYMVVHLVTNASIWNGAEAFQKNVDTIHSLGVALVVVEWTFIFLPILFHAIFGLLIIREGTPNTSSYALSGNIRYTLQRATGLLAFGFIGFHVAHLHGWIHVDWWLENVIVPLGGARFDPHNASATAAAALRSSPFVSVLYLIGTTACVFHLANGIWTMGITWGLWTTPESQRRANWVAIGVGTVVGIVGLAAWTGFLFNDEIDVESRNANEHRQVNADPDGTRLE
ncbi:MAG: succinate dehydrogenase [Pirellulaceae bacterium]|nr:succinate dehydrogenase [Pirellulaceae bacterium]MDP7015003.1 succinate dehydrogenase [Pirellulaceae bacterium]